MPIPILIPMQASNGPAPLWAWYMLGAIVLATLVLIAFIIRTYFEFRGY